MRTHVFVLAGLLAMTGAACSRNGNDKTLESPPTVFDDVGAHLVTARGCLTGDDNRYVLTTLVPGVPGPGATETNGEDPLVKPEPTTETYRLVGMADRLHPLVGQQVEVSGAAEPEKVVDVQEMTQPVDPRAPSSNKRATAASTHPNVSTTESTHVEIHDMRVISVDPTGEPCSAD